MEVHLLVVALFDFVGQVVDVYSPGYQLLPLYVDNLLGCPLLGGLQKTHPIEHHSCLPEVALEDLLVHLGELLVIVYKQPPSELDRHDVEEGVRYLRLCD